MLTKNELKALWIEHSFRPLKRFGQNFLIDKNMKDKILRNLEISPDDTVIEIGPGFGELTFDLARISKKVFAVEKDKKIAGILRDALPLPENVTLLNEDFLDTDIKKIAGRGKAVIYGNLPYYITSPILEKIFDNIKHVKSAYFVVQKEFAERLTALPGSKDIGRVSLYAQYYSRPNVLFTIGKGCFYPEPDVESVFIKLEMRGKKAVNVEEEGLLFKIVKTAYSQRRKTILNPLLSLGFKKEELRNLLNSAKVDPKSRAEDLSLEDFARLVKSLS